VVTPVRLALVLGPLTALLPTPAFAEDVKSGTEKDSDSEHTLVLGAGGAMELELLDGSLHLGANVMVEWEAIENWLELEVGASLLADAHGVEVPVDLLVKKPFKLARWAEFMFGVGPEIVHVTGSNQGTYFGGEASLDFMFWPSGHRIGLWVEPEYDLIFERTPSSGIGATGGLLFGW
jgi:hypothetical protein